MAELMKLHEMRDLAKAEAKLAVEALRDVARDLKADAAARLSAAKLLLELGYGKALLRYPGQNVSCD